MKKEINIPKIVWVSGIFVLLIVILLLVMDYKINYQFASKNIMYFYSCDEELCIARIKDNSKKLFSKYECGYNDCPEYKKQISDDYALLEENKKNILYNFKKGTIITDKYESYEQIDSEYLIISKNNKYGIMKLTGQEIVAPTYDNIGKRENNFLTGYNSNAIIAKKNNKYGLISYRTGKLIEEFKFTDSNLDNLWDLLKEDS